MSWLGTGRSGVLAMLWLIEGILDPRFAGTILPSDIPAERSAESWHAQ